ncbi:unnamed protein product [Musa acuminata subsp. malaccensis]|nr:unnamed protein product [Musa acuminata subsp. malaccensis]
MMLPKFIAGRKLSATGSLISVRGLVKDVSGWNSLFSMRRAARLY